MTSKSYYDTISDAFASIKLLCIQPDFYYLIQKHLKAVQSSFKKQSLFKASLNLYV